MTVPGRNALLIGGNGRVARLTMPLLHAAGFAVTAVTRNKDHADAVASLGAAPVLQDVTRADRHTWWTLFADTDVVIWAAGSSGSAAPEVARRIDRDAVITLIDALDATAYPPRFLTIGVAGTVFAQSPSPPGGAAFLSAKRDVDKRLCASKLADAAILGPAALNDSPARGIALLDVDFPAPPRDGAPTTSRELVARVIVELALRSPTLGKMRLNFVDGGGRVALV